VEELYGRRARAFAEGTPELLGAVYAPGSPQLAADEVHVSALAGAGETLRGFAPVVVEVTRWSVGPDRTRLDLVDRWADYDVVAARSADGPALRRAPGRPATGVAMVLVRTPDGWRIESAERVG
jgi:eukaryotic-like serine/threonine-protein kinase